nr:uncharacterized protein LOC109760198 isoform X1 [Aegilops tauschii subsp. strangulata]
MRRDLQIEETTQNGSSLPQPYRCSPSSHAQVRRGRKQGLGATPARRQSDAQPSLLKDCIGAIDGTHVRAGVTKDVEHSFRGRKAFTTQNVMAAVDFDLRFTYVLAGWEGLAHDATVLADALTRERGLQVPPVLPS